MDWMDEFLGVSAPPNPGDVPPPLDDIRSTVTASELAVILGLSLRQLHSLAASGLLETVGRNAYPARRCILAYIERQRSRHGSDALAGAKLRQAEAAAAKLEIGNQKARGGLLEASEVERTWTTALRDVRAALLAVPARVGSHLSPTDVARVDCEIRAALEFLAKGDSCDRD